MAHLIKARDISLFASKSLNTETDPWSKHRSTTFQGHVEKKFQNGNKRELSDFGRMATAEFKKQLEKAKGELGAMRAGVYKLIWNAIFDMLTGEHPYQSFGDVIEGYPFTTRITLFPQMQPYDLVITMRMFFPELVKGKLAIWTKRVGTC